jgi:hypothetical protein
MKLFPYVHFLILSFLCFTFGLICAIVSFYNAFPLYFFIGLAFVAFSCFFGSFFAYEFIYFKNSQKVNKYLQEQIKESLLERKKEQELNPFEEFEDNE